MAHLFAAEVGHTGWALGKSAPVQATPVAMQAMVGVNVSSQIDAELEAPIDPDV